MTCSDYHFDQTSSNCQQTLWIGCRWGRVDEHHKVQRFCKTIESKSLVLVLYRSDLGATELTNSVIPKQHLEPKLVNSVETSHSSVAPRLLGFHRILNSVTPICTFRFDRKAHVQWPKPNRWDLFYDSVGPRWVLWRANPKIFENQSRPKEVLAR